MKNVYFVYSAVSPIQNLGFGKKFDRIAVGTGVACASSSDIVQYHAYYKFVGL